MEFPSPYHMISDTLYMIIYYHLHKIKKIRDMVVKPLLVNQQDSMHSLLIDD
jgi:hypothetical protein